jgi:hypothetical protein
LNGKSSHKESGVAVAPGNGGSSPSQVSIQFNYFDIVMYSKRFPKSVTIA